MSAIFWILWIVDLALAIVTMLAKDFRQSFTATSMNTWFTVVLFVALIGGVLLQVVFKKPVWSLVAVAMPLAILLVWYMVDES